MALVAAGLRWVCPPENTTATMATETSGTAAMTEGSSGSALLDPDSELSGLTGAVGVSRVGVEGVGFAIPVEDVIAIVVALTNL